MKAIVVDDAKDLARIAVERSNLYGFLATIFRGEPSADQIRTIRDGDFLDALSDAGVALGDDIVGCADDALAETLAIEYTRLFIGPGKHIAPSEAAQREGALWGKTTSKVAALITGAGFQYKHEYCELPDHISVELEFMQEVTRREATAWSQSDCAEARRCLAIEWQFIDNHLARWAPAFFRRVADTATSSYYKEFAKLARRFIEQENETIETQLGRDERLSRVVPVPPPQPRSSRCR